MPKNVLLFQIRGISITSWEGIVKSTIGLRRSKQNVLKYLAQINRNDQTARKWMFDFFHCTTHPKTAKTVAVPLNCPKFAFLDMWVYIKQSLMLIAA